MSPKCSSSSETSKRSSEERLQTGSCKPLFGTTILFSFSSTENVYDGVLFSPQMLKKYATFRGYQDPFCFENAYMHHECKINPHPLPKYPPPMRKHRGTGLRAACTVTGGKASLITRSRQIMCPPPGTPIGQKIGTLGGGYIISFSVPGGGTLFGW